MRCVRALQVMEECQGWGGVWVRGGGCSVAHSAPFFLFIPRCLGFPLVALVSSNFLMKRKFIFCQKLISLRLQSSRAQCPHCSHEWNILMSYLFS